MKAYLATAAVLSLASLSLAAWAAPAKKPVAPKKALPAPVPMGAGEKLDAKRIWPASLEQIAGRYTFVQVASPGGFWERATSATGEETHRQVSINEVPAAFREKLLNAEIIISDLKSPRRIEAVERLSPTKRGMLRFYDEEGQGSLVVRNLPGVSGEEEAQDYSGPVILHIQHQSHSNPSVHGILSQRAHEEATWGAATLDSATLSATSIPANENDEGLAVLTNARILRSGIEIFAFVEWLEKEGTANRLITGSVRLVRQADAGKENAAK